MPATFTRAPRVAAGEILNSAQYRGLARAFNDRIRLIGDLAWRISWYWFTLWRQVRNPDSSGFSFPPQGEWFDIYAHIDPDYASIEWPASAPGEPEGANLGNPAMQAIFGVAGGPDDEPTRSQIPMAKPSSLSGYWALGKSQRGAYDPATGAMNAPAFDAALGLLNFAFNGIVPMHKGYGGWLPQPVRLLDDCGTTETSGMGIPSYEIKFTALRDGVATAAYHGTVGSDGEGRTTVAYAGTCPCGSEYHDAGHVLGVVRHPLYYVVYVSRGADCAYDVDFFSTRDWLEGPYEAEPYLAHTEGGQIQRAAHQFVTDFRGSDEQRADDTFRIEDVAFASQEFFTRQYALAPARGVQAGNLISEQYPTCALSGIGQLSEGTYGSWSPGQSEYPIADGFVAAGWYASASGLAGPAILEVLDGDTRIGAVTLQPDGNGVAEDLRWLPHGVAASRLRMRLVTSVPLRNGGAGSIVVEVAELLSWRPFYWDAFVVNRNGASLGGDQIGAGVDGRGIDCEVAPEITRDLFRYGCIVNDAATALRPQAEWVNDNPLYDAMRRATRGQVRITQRRQLVGYEVNAEGKSVLYFKRFAYGLAADRVDMFDGIAPPVSAIWTLREGERYVVHGTSGAVTYRGSSYAIGSQFVAAAEDLTFAVSGDARVYVHDGIKHAALKGGSTNEWVIFLETKCYHPSESSIWKASAYSDYFTWNQRCLFYPLTMPAVVRQHVAVQYGVAMDGDDFSLERLPFGIQTTILAPEAPPGYRYVAGTNSSSPTEQFCKACRIYESPYEVESCTVDDWSADQVVKVVLKTRMRSHPDAPATVGRNAGSWSAGEVTALAAEDWRSDDNAVREYMRHQADPEYHCSRKEGDWGAGSGLPFMPDNPFGSCYPTIHFVRLIPEPYEDGNATMEPTDTRAVVDAYQQMECYLRIMCEAFVDGRTSAELVCLLDGGDIYDYTFENLCFDAFGGRWIGTFSPSIRPDEPPGFGPLPNTIIYAEVHNRIAAAVDLLTKLRVDIPTVVSVRQWDGQATKTVLAGVDCTETGAVAVYADAQVVPAVPQIAMTAGSWDPVTLPTVLTTEQVSDMTGCPFVIRNLRTDREYKIEIDTVFSHAIPVWLAEIFATSRVSLISRTTHTRTFYSRQATDLASSDGCCNADDLPCPGHWPGGGGVYYRWQPTITTEVECGSAPQRTIFAGLPPTGDYNLGRSADMPDDVWCGIGSADRREVFLFDSTPFVEFELRDPE